MCTGGFVCRSEGDATTQSVAIEYSSTRIKKASLITQKQNQQHIAPTVSQQRNMPCQSSSDDQPEAIYSSVQNRRNFLDELPQSVSSMGDNRQPILWSPMYQGLPPRTTATITTSTHHRAAYLISILDRALDIYKTIDLDETNQSSDVEEPSDTIL